MSEAAEDLAGNWQNWDSFVWFGEKDCELSENVFIWNQSSRISGLTERVNREVISQRLLPHVKSGDVWYESHSCSMRGNVNAILVRVYDRDDNITAGFREVYDILCELDDFSILDEIAFSEAEDEATFENVSGMEGLFQNPDGDWCDRVMLWLSEHEPDALECFGDEGAFPPKEAVVRAGVAVGLIPS